MGREGLDHTVEAEVDVVVTAAMSLVTTLRDHLRETMSATAGLVVAKG